MARKNCSKTNRFFRKMNETNRRRLDMEKCSKTKKGRFDMALAKRPKGKKITFSLSAPEANEVTLAGDFNNWDYTATSLKKDKNAVWRKDLSLRPGRYEYKFVVDGNWISDPDNSNKAWNSFGTENSVIEV